MLLPKLFNFFYMLFLKFSSYFRYCFKQINFLL